MIYRCAITSLNMMAASRKSTQLGIWRKNEISSIKEKVKSFLTDRKQANNLLEIISALEADDNGIISAGLNALTNIFTTLIQQKEMHLSRPITENEELIERTAEEKYKIWLQDCYNDTITKLSEALSSDKPTLQHLALMNLMKCIIAEGEVPMVKVKKEKSRFPSHLLQVVVLSLLSNTSDMKATIVRYEEYIEHQDVKFHTLKIIKQQLEAVKDEENNNIFLCNCLTLMERTLLNPNNTSNNKVKILCRRPMLKHPSKLEYCGEKMKKLFNEVWMDFLRKKLNASLYRRTLIILHEKVLVHLECPLLLTDFFLDAYDIGGPISLLALNGIFILMQKHNLEFPEFYKKLYALFEPGIFHTKYRARFFYLVDIFLSSTHLPAYVVAAFCKRLSRLALKAPPHCLQFVIPFIKNLMLRYPNLDKMIHNPDRPEDLSSDPFLADEANLADCRALDSCLWEMKTLQQHYNPNISSLATFIDKPLPDVEMDITWCLELDYSKVIKQRKRVKSNKDIVFNFERPTGLFSTPGDKMGDFWTF